MVVNVANNNLFFSSYYKSAILKNIISSYEKYKDSQGIEYLPSEDRKNQILNYLKTKNKDFTLKNNPIEINFFFMNLINPEYEKTLISNQHNRTLLGYYCDGLNNLQYDIKNSMAYYERIKPMRVLYKKDLNSYNLINKKIHYKDLSLTAILGKIKHKISKNAYKKALRNIKNNLFLDFALSSINPILPNAYYIGNNKKVLSKVEYILINPNVKSFINSYLKTIKTHKSKNTLSFSNRLNKRIISLKYAGQFYSVVLKKLSRFGYDDSDLLREFKTRLSNSYILKTQKYPTI